MMRRGQAQLLLPASPLFIGLSLLIALLANLLPLGRAVWMPDLLAVVLVFWSVHQPARVGLGVAFALGLVMDVHQSALLGQHALSYATLSFFAIMLHRRLLWLSVFSQMLQLLPLFVASQLLVLLIRMVAGGAFPGWWLLAAPVAEAALWPIATWLLLAPQRRAPEPDENRPL